MGERKVCLPGYSLTELLVVIMLFALAMGILMDTYIQFTRLSHKTSNAAVVQQDSRFAFEYIARAVRNTPIDYSVTWAISSSTLRLLPTNGSAIIITQSPAGDARCGDAAAISCLLVSTNGGVNWAPLTSKSVNVKKFKVYLQPTTSPFVLTGSPADYPTDQQPFVTVQMELEYVAARAVENATMNAQTTISSRVYVR